MWPEIDSVTSPFEKMVQEFIKLVETEDLPLFYESYSRKYSRLSEIIFETPVSRRTIKAGLRGTLSGCAAKLVDPPHHVRDCLNRGGVSVKTISPNLVCQVLKSKPKLGLTKVTSEELILFVFDDFDQLPHPKQLTLIESIAGLHCIPLKK